MNADFDWIFDVYSVFPEYLNDFGVIACPSDPDAREIEAHVSIVPQFSIETGLPCPSQAVGYATSGDDSFVYMGWIIDQADDDGPHMPCINPQGAATLPPGIQVSTQVTAFIVHLQEVSKTAQHPNGALGTSTDGGNRSTLEGDINLTTAATAIGYPSPGTLGTGGSNTLRRIKEGIERFLITDINNPAASAVAQSGVPVMFDLANLMPAGNAKFNHVPGGINILYMDGHAAFVRYPDKKYPGNVGWSAISQCISP